MCSKEEEKKHPDNYGINHDDVDNKDEQSSSTVPLPDPPSSRSMAAKALAEPGGIASGAAAADARGYPDNSERSNFTADGENSTG